MNRIDLNAYGVKELSSKQQAEINGGIEYFEYTWSYSSLPATTFEGVANGCKAIANGFIWLYNQLS